jgi:RNA polymerase sigma factor (TIGR02999 family)
MTAPTPTPLSQGHFDFESVYGALRAQARRYLRSEQNAQSLSPTVLVHEAWMALARSRRQNIGDRTHYVRLLSRVMKNLLIDHARRKKALTNGGAMQRVEWDDATAAAENNCDLTLAIATAMDDLAILSPRLATLVELRYFGGFTEAEVAQIMHLSVRSVRRQWRVARLRLLEVLKSTESAGSNGHE